MCAGRRAHSHPKGGYPPRVLAQGARDTVGVDVAHFERRRPRPLALSQGVDAVENLPPLSSGNFAIRQMDIGAKHVNRDFTDDDGR